MMSDYEAVVDDAEHARDSTSQFPLNSNCDVIFLCDVIASCIRNNVSLNMTKIVMLKIKTAK